MSIINVLLFFCPNSYLGILLYIMVPKYKLASNWDETAVFTIVLCMNVVCISLLIE